MQQKHVVATGRSDFQRATDRFLSFEGSHNDLFVVRLVEDVIQTAFHVRDLAFALEKAGRLPRILHRDDPASLPLPPPPPLHAVPAPSAILQLFVP